MTTKNIRINAKTQASKVAFSEVKTHLPTAKFKKLISVPSLGYVLYIYDENKKAVAHLFKERDGLTLSIKGA